MQVDRPNPRNVSPFTPTWIEHGVIEHDDYDCWCDGWHSLTEARRLNAAFRPPSRLARLRAWVGRRV